MPIVERLFTEIKPAGSYDFEPPKPLSVYFSRPAIVVLGDPGAGKTTSFEVAAKAEPDAEYVQIRDFIALSTERWRNKVLYLDGLDEQRARTKDGATALDQIRSKLDELGCPLFRLSCRAADWYGSSDIERLTLVSHDKTVTALTLEPLTEQDIVAIAGEKVSDAQSFIESAKHHGVYELLTNPLSLDLFLKVIVEDGDWPSTRLKLYERACMILAKENNKEHTEVLPYNVTTEVIVNAAGYLSAVLLCGGSQGIALAEQSANQGFPFIGDLSSKQDELRLAARRRIFRAEGYERVVPTHRTIAEFVAARYFANSIREGLPIGRVISLITANDGCTLSDLRGLFAWLACLCPEHAESLIPKDPFGVVLYGDPAALSLTAKKMVIKNLVDLARRNPWFRSAENWASRPLGGLASQDMESIFREIIEYPSQHPVALSCVLDAIRYGTPLPGLGDLLLDVVRDEKRREYLRVDALQAFIHACPYRTSDLVQLLEDINGNHIKDDDNGLRGNLLHALYPAVIGVPQILDYLVGEHANIYNDYNRFLDDYLLETTNSQQIPELLDGVVKSNFLQISEECFSCKRFVGNLLASALANYGETVSVDRLYAWVMITVDENGTKLIESDKSQEIIEWFKSRSATVAQMFFHLVTIVTPDRVTYEEYRLRSVLSGLSYPEGLAQRMLEQAVVEQNVQKAEFLFKKAVQFSYQGDRRDAPSLDDLFAFVGKHLPFRGVLESLLFSPLTAQYIKLQIQHIEHERQHKSKRVAFIENIKTKIDKVRSGEDVDSLAVMANIYFGLYTDVNRTLLPGDRLIAMAGDELAGAAVEGFNYIVRKIPLHTPRQVGELHAESSRHYTYGIVILAAMDMLATCSIEGLLTLPDGNLQTALTYHYVISTGGEREWINLILTKRPALAAEAMGAFWRPHFEKNVTDIPGLHSFAHDDKMGEVAKLQAPLLLRENPNCSEQNLRYLMRAALLHVEHKLLLNLVVDILSQRGLVRGMQRVCWLSAGYILSADKFQMKVVKYVNEDRKKVARLLDFISQVGLDLLKKKPSDIAFLISIIGSVLPPYAGNESEWVHDIFAEEDQARYIEGLLTLLGNDISREATRALTDLHANPALASWRESIAQKRATQIQQRREAEFRYPTVAQVIVTLQGGQPSNAADLQALLMDNLKTINEELRHGLTDGYKAFWNLDSHGRTTNPIPENDCRDRFLDLIRPRLLRLGVNAEPEGHYAQDKRADIKALFGPMNIPIEIKRHYHPALWTAPVEQLQKLYVRDPGTQDRGIYLVFWFGIKVRNVPKPPRGIVRPTTFTELQTALQNIIPEQDRALIEAIVIDCSSNLKEHKVVKKKISARSKGRKKSKLKTRQR